VNLMAQYIPDVWVAPIIPSARIVQTDLIAPKSQTAPIARVRLIALIARVRLIALIAPTGRFQNLRILHPKTPRMNQMEQKAENPSCRKIVILRKMNLNLFPLA
jgi:hypothetical protein